MALRSRRAGRSAGRTASSRRASVHDFHSSAATSDEIARFGSVDEVSAIWRENIDEIAAFEGETISPEELAELAAFGETLPPRQ